MEFVENILVRLRAFADKSAWILIAVGAIVLGIADLQMLITLVKWSSFVLVAAGGAIMLSKIFFPTVRFSELLPMVKEGNVAVALIVAAVMIFGAASFYTVVFWAK